jgi:exopolyphosphatase/guanosine-5'-triphosphate,3'-diphosphate pyrophosphatase
MKRLATIDLGTNTALLLISEWVDGRLKVVRDEGGFVRLGEGMDASSRVGDAALARLRSIMGKHAKTIAGAQVDRVIVTGTSASRDAEDRERIESVIREELGTSLVVLSGPEEALASSTGALAGLSGPFDESVVVIDVGGGSTEFVQLSEPLVSRSLNMGTVRLSERFFSSDPPNITQIERARGWIDGELEEGLTSFIPASACVGASGTAIVLAHLLGAPGDAILVRDIKLFSDRLLAMDTASILALDPSRMRGRADVFAMGVLILYRALKHLRSPSLRASTFGVRHGVAIRCFQEYEAGRPGSEEPSWGR